MSSTDAKRYIKNKRRMLKNTREISRSHIPMDTSAEINKLFGFRKRKEQRTSEYMCESIRKTKLLASKSAEKQISYSPLKKQVTADDFRKFVQKAPYTEMSRFQEKDILKKVQAKELEVTYKHLLADMVKEVKLEFLKITHYAGLKKKIKSSREEVSYLIEPYKFQGRTKNYHEFLKIRKHFRDKWILHLPIIKIIQQECILKLPHELLHLQFSKSFPLNNIEDILRDKVRSVSEFIYEFHKSIVRIVDKEEDKQSKRHLQHSSYLKACTGMLSLHISKSIAHTLSYIVTAASSTGITPYLVLDVSFKNDLVLSPTVQDVINSLCDFMDNIIDTGREMHVLERFRIKGFENKFVTLCLTEDFISKCKNTLRENITQHFKPIMEHIDNLNSQFREIYCNINSEDFFTSIADIDFETGCNKINYYRNFLNKVMFIPDHEFFQIGKMYLIDYREELHQGLSRNINAIFEKLCSQHFWEITDLCETFEMIQTRAQLKPLTTEELIETGKYITWIRNEHFDELKTRTHESLSSLCRFIELGIITEEHIAKNCSVIHWLEDIIPIIDEHAVTFDQLKFDAEERLQKVVEDVNVMINEVFSLLVILDRMDDISRVRNYMHAITLHMTKIKEIEKHITWINNEEVSFYNFNICTIV